MKIYIAIQQEVEPRDAAIVAEGSIEKLKRRLRQDFNPAIWSIRTQQFRPTRETLCNLIESIYGTAETTETYSTKRKSS